MQVAPPFLFRHQTSPLPDNGGAANAPSSWLHAVAGIWWLLGARVLVAFMSFTLNYNRRWREARLFPDLTAAAIYIAAISVVVISVLALPIGGGELKRRSSSSSQEFFKSAKILSLLGSTQLALLGPASISVKSVYSLARPMRPRPQLALIASSMDWTAMS
jgi:hypothetical protein